MKSSQILLNGQTINVKIIPKKNKNIYFRFDNEKNLIVTAPYRISERKILKLIKENEKALTKMLERTEKKRDNEDELRLLGLKYDLKIEDTFENVYIDGGIIYAKNKTVLNKFIGDLTKKNICRRN